MKIQIPQFFGSARKIGIKKIEMRINTRISLFIYINLLSLSCFAQTWSPLPITTNEHLKAVYFVNEQIGWIGGTNGAIFKTSDGGQTWIDQSQVTTKSIRCMHFTNALYGWAAGDNGILYATVNGGLNWTPQISNTTQQINSIKFTSNTNGWFVANNSTIKKTTTGGSSWNAVNNATINSNLWGLSILDPNNIFISGSSQRISKTSNGGSNWGNFSSLPGGPITIYNDLQLINSTNGWAVNSILNNNGNIAYYNGTIWTGQQTASSSDILNIHMINVNQGWACGRNGTILNTTNATGISGQIWNSDVSGTAKTLWDIKFVNDSMGWTVGDSGIVLKYQKLNTGAPITLFQPNGGENYTITGAGPIVWYANAPVNNIKIEYSLNNGGIWNTIVANLPVSSGVGSYAWTISQSVQPSLQALVRITDNANSINKDVSDNVLNILPKLVGKEYAVLLTANATNSPAQININWNNDPTALSYDIDKKLKSDTTWTNLTNVNGTTNTYLDLAVKYGEAFEYRVKKTTPQLTGYGYVYAGIDLPETDFRGKILLLIDQNFASQITSELKQLELDLIGDGYLVKKQIVDPTVGVPAIKNIIKQEYSASNSLLSTVLIIGHLAAPYSGNFAPDGHSERVGAQPADGYYGDLDGIWTDNISVVNTGVIYTPNNPGDGKFDQSFFPSLLELQVGRIDMDKMSGFPESEVNLIKRYLNKNHDYRFAVISVKNRGLINSTMDASLPNTSAGAWRSFSTMFGNNIKNMNTVYAGSTEFIDSLKYNDYLWAHMAGGGSDTSMSTDVFTSSKCISGNINAVFMQMYGSYFVEWYKGGINTTTNHLLRAPLASNGTTLATMWSGKAPFWHFHHMSLGETIGYSTLINQNNNSTYDGSSTHKRGVHMNLMGDPTLKQHIVIPISNLLVLKTGNAISISWTSSPDNVAGYNIYRADSINGMFTKINSNYITQNNFMDNNPAIGNNVYMVRAVKLEKTPSASYFNMSTGVIDSINIQLNIMELIGVKFSFDLYPNPSNGNLNLKLFSHHNFTTKIKIFNAIGEQVYSNSYAILKGNNLISMDFSYLTNGIYVFLISNGENELQYRKLMINQ
ncbi:MAG: YCF48-related protein [bacterium]|nr:YCF48-related protein [bacterium]